MDLSAIHQVAINGKTGLELGTVGNIILLVVSIVSTYFALKNKIDKIALNVATNTGMIESAISKRENDIKEINTLVNKEILEIKDSNEKIINDLIRRFNDEIIELKKQTESKTNKLELGLEKININITNIIEKKIHDTNLEIKNVTSTIFKKIDELRFDLINYNNNYNELQLKLITLIADIENFNKYEMKNLLDTVKRLKEDNDKQNSLIRTIENKVTKLKHKK